MRTLVTAITLLVNTIVLGTLVTVADYLGFRKGPGTIFDRAPRWWARALLATGGVKVVVHDAHRLEGERSRVFAANHLSWFDVLALASVLPHYAFVAKSELFKIPIFGRGARAVGTIPIDRDNRKAAFQSYEEAAALVRTGASIVVYPEGTRGTVYPLRQFKKGPFVLAIAAGTPVVPTLVYGAIEVLRRGSLWLKPGTIHIHLLEPVETTGMTYDDRDRLAGLVRERMAAELERLYGIRSPATELKRSTPAAALPVEE